MIVQLNEVLLGVVSFLAGEGQCFSEHSGAQHLKLLRWRREEGLKAPLELRGQPVAVGMATEDTRKGYAADWGGEGRRGERTAGTGGSSYVLVYLVAESMMCSLCRESTASWPSSFPWSSLTSLL